jgi:hypothetical protein
MTHFFIEKCETQMAELYGELYIKGNQIDCPGWEDDPWGALQFFLSAYAFERQAAPSDYACAAYDTISEFADKELTESTAQEVWDSFSSKLLGISLNHKNNPLCPYGVAYSTKTGEKTTNQISVIELVAREMSGKSIVLWAKDQLKKGKVRHAYNSLCQVNGIADKITPYFLRDIATIYSIVPAKDRDWIQPVDTWIRFVANFLAGREDLSDEDCIDYLMNNSENPERANQGIWLYCVDIAHSSAYLVREAISSNGQYMDEQIEYFIRSQRRRAECISLFASRWEFET